MKISRNKLLNKDGDTQQAITFNERPLAIIFRGGGATPENFENQVAKTHISWILNVVGKKLRVYSTNSCTCHMVLVKIEGKKLI